MGRGGRACPKASVPLAVERHQRKLTREKALDEAIVDAKRRDGHRCRWPRCEYSGIRQPLDGAHVFQAKGMGGDPQLLRSERKYIMAICRLHHREQEKHEIVIEPLTPDFADGPCGFWTTDGADRYLIAQERTIGVYERD